jgi:hypothetical protein
MTTAAHTPPTTESFRDDDGMLISSWCYTLIRTTVQL